MKNTFHYDTIAKAIRFIRSNHIAQPSLDQIAQHVHLSKYHLQRTFRKWAGISPKEFLQYITIEKAKESLLKGQSTLETSYQVGLSGNGRLHDLFIKMEACTPGEFQKRGKNLEIHIDQIDTPFGIATIAETIRGICNLSFDTEAKKTIQAEYPQAEFVSGLSVNGNLVKQYFQNWGIPTQTIGLDLVGTSFQIQVWKALLQIPSAHLLAYKDVAHLIDKPNASRAVGTAIGKNPIAYLIPCHRVIQKNGVVGNYRWTPERKMAINSYESIRLN